MKPAPFNFVRAASVAEATALAAGHRGFAKFIAGGQSLGPMLNLRMTQPDLVIDISHLKELRGVDDGDEYLSIGAGVAHADIEDGSLSDITKSMLAYIAGGISYRAVRNRGTLGGSLAHADPAADWPVAMIALGAEILVQGAEEARTIAAAAFIDGPLSTALADDEIITSIAVPKLSTEAGWGYRKLCRKVGEFAQSLAAVVVDPLHGHARAALGSAVAAPMLLPLTSAALTEGGDIGAAVDSDLDASDFRFDTYERQVHRTLVQRAAADALKAGP